MKGRYSKYLFNLNNIIDNNNSDSGNSEEIETKNNIAFKRMKINGETDQDSNISQSSPTIMDNNNSSSNSINENEKSSNHFLNNDFSSIQNQITPMDSYSSSNPEAFEQINNKAISNTRDDMYQAPPYTPIRNSTNNFDDSSSSDESSSPPPYESLYQPSIQRSYKDHIPGTTGLNNLGNTCFMNSGLQCIAHTNLLRDYLLKGYWKKELNLTSKHGMKGKMVKAFVKVLENLWSKNDGPYRPSEFKSVISKHTPSFEGYHQHDCQEFIASLLDGLHEDINRVPIKKFEEYPDMNEMEDEEAAKTSWDLHIRRENSFIVDLFYGQYRSINICQECKTVRKNFEPFVYLTLPIPENQEIEIPIQVLLNGKLINNVRINILKSDSIATLKDKICEKLKESEYINEIEISRNNIEVFQCHNHNMNAYLSNSELVENIQSLELSYYVLYAYIITNDYSIDVIKNYLPPQKEDEKNNKIPTSFNVPIYHKVEDADKYNSEDNGFPFLINLPNLKHLEDEEKKINRRLLGWIVYREIVKYYQNFTEFTIATMDPAAELDPKVLERIKQIREEEESLNKGIASKMNKTEKNSSSSDDEGDDSNTNKNEDKTNILSNDDDTDSQRANASSNNDASLSDIQLNDSINESIRKEMETEEVNPINEDEDTLLETTYQETQAKHSNAVASAGDAIVNAKPVEKVKDKNENKEEDVDVLYPINDGWKIMPKLFDVQLVYTDKSNESFYSYSYTYNGKLVALYNTKDNSSKENDSYRTKSYGSSYSIASENKSAKVEMEPKDLIIIVTWKPALLKFLFGETKFKVFSPKESEEVVKKPEAQPISLEECIQEFIKEEILTDENKWFCPHCKEDREAYKKMDIWKAPEILIVHLKRFIQDRRYYSSRKNNVLVTFPIKGLDLTDIIQGPNMDGEKYIYNLYAISNHSGSTGGGHYTAYVKTDDKWYDCNDSYVSEVSDENSIITSSAYLLFYERCHEPGKEFKLPDLEGKQDVVDEEEIKEQMLLQQRRAMPMEPNTSMGMGMSNMNNEIRSGMYSYTTTTVTPDYTMTSTYHNPSTEDFADFNNASNMYTTVSNNAGALVPANPMEISNHNMGISTEDEVLYDANESIEDSENLSNNDNDTVVDVEVIEEKDNMEN
jgi:ubiquitin C-terminal hydrolase